MTDLVCVLDVTTFRPNREYFRGIGCEEDFGNYMIEENKNRDVQLFYFDKLIEFLKKDLDFNRHPKVKKRFIIYFNARGVISNKIANKFRESQSTDAIIKYMKIIFGSNSLFLYLGSIIKDKKCFVRFYSKERCILSQDLMDTIKDDFQHCKLVHSSCNTFSTKTLEDDLSRFNSPHFEIKKLDCSTNYINSTDSVSNLATDGSTARSSVYSYSSTSTQASSIKSSNIENNPRAASLPMPSINESMNEEEETKILEILDCEEFTNEFYTNCRNELYTKCINHFKTKKTQDAITFMSTLENLVVQHVGKRMKENKMKLDESKARYFCCYLRDNLIDMGVLTGFMVEFWRTQRINDFDRMKEMSRVTFNLKGLYEILIEQKIVPDPNAENKVTEEEKFQLKVDSYKILCFNILKILIKFKFYSTGNVALNEESYQSQLYGAVKAHSTSKHTNKHDCDLIKSDYNINQIMLHICKRFQVIDTNNNKFEFNTTEIENVIIDYKKDEIFLRNRIRPFIEEYFEMLQSPQSEQIAKVYSISY